METQTPAAQNQSSTSASWRATAAGVLGAGSALATGELLSGLSRRIPSLVVAVGDVVVRRTDGETASAANEVLGSNNKPFLLFSITVLSLVFGAAAARLARRRTAVLAAVFAGFGLFGAWAAATYPLASAGLGVASALLAALVGWIVTRALLSRAEAVQDPSGTASLTVDDGDAAGLHRRRFVTGSVAAAAGAAVTAGVGRSLRANDTVEVERAQVADQLAAVRPQATPVAMDSEVADIDGISAYITPTDEFYRIDTSLQLPQIDPDDWRLDITGLVDRPMTLTLDDLLSDELIDATVTISCVSNPIGGDLAGTAVWTGVPLERLFERAGVQPEATQVVGRSFTGWTGGFPRSVVGDGRTTLVAIGMNGEPLPVKHGFPARLIIAGLYGYVSATKWLSEIQLTRWEDFDGYWIDRQWAKEGPVKITSRIDVPRSGERMPAGTVVLAGVAWAPTVGIDRVEVLLDSLDRWIPADLGAVVSGETWVQWSVALDLTAGTHIAAVRAIDRNGDVQPVGPRPPFPDGAEGYHRIRFEVT